MIRPRLTDYHGIHIPQADLDFAIPFLREDVPLYVDPFLLWRSPSYQDKALHNAILNSFNHLGYLVKTGLTEEARRQLIIASECEEVGLGVSIHRAGSRIGERQASQILDLFGQIPEYDRRGFTHFEEIQFFVDGIARDRISDFACSFMKSFLIDFTIDQCESQGIPLAACSIAYLYDPEGGSFARDVPVHLPVNPDTGAPILLVPKRWLRFGPWLDFEEYFRAYCPRDEAINPGATPTRVRVLQYNRDNYGAVEAYVRRKEQAAADCANDPLFKQLPVLSAKRRLATIRKLPTGKTGGADRKYEDSAAELLASLLYPKLDFADVQSRTDSGVNIRDLIFYNNRAHPLLRDLFEEYGTRQVVMELKNVHAVEREHINQLNRYMTNAFGRFGVLITRYELPRAMRKNTIDLWAGQRRCIIALTDADLEQMVEIYGSRQRDPIDVLTKKYVEFRRDCPS
jgi:hypothetical protein